ncbi:MAG: hypothetical protein M4D80_30260 [Myxococcota bacterium]|nr:hypothetical protein [Myxococcota bacterium]
MYRLLLGVVCVVACGKSKEGETPRLITEAEIAAYEAALMGRIAETRSRTCKRPVLRGRPVPGTAAADLHALAQPAGELATCDAQLAKLGNITAAAAARDAAFVAIVHECGPRYEAALVKAVAHEDACSPYQAGVLTAQSLISTLRTARVIGVRAVDRAAAGDAVGGLWLVLDAMRFADDLARGHTSMLDLMIAVAVSNTLADYAFEIVAAHPLPPEKAAELSAALGILLAHQQPFADTFRGERDLMDLHYALAPLKPKEWVPPGGWPEGKDTRAGARGELLTKNPRDEHAILFLTSEGFARDTAAACPPTATLEACAKAFGEAAPATEHDQASLAKIYDELANARDLDAARLKIRGALVDVLGAVARPAFGDYVRKRGNAIAKLAAVRIHLELGRRAASGTCPPTIDLPDELLAPHGLGGRMQLTVTNDGVGIAPPAWAAGTKTPPLPAWKCPAK